MMRTLKDIGDLKDKKVLLRTDFDVPVSGDGIIQEVFRIKKQKPMIDYLFNQGAITIMVAHISDEDVKSFDDLTSQLREILGHEVKYFDALNDLDGLKKLQPGFVGILHNIRDYEGEVKNDKEFAKKLAEGFDYYINNAFAVCHREHASVSAITGFLPSYAGPLIEEEAGQLTKVISAPAEGKILIVGGAKASTKIPVIKNFLSRVDKILVGGVMANDILKKEGVELNGSRFDNDLDELLAGLDIRHYKIIMPSDYNIYKGKYLDIGPSSVENFGNIISSAKIVIWNGPLGFFEDERFAIGTNSIAERIISSKAFNVIGGGDTIAAVNKIGILDKFDFVSTGGGAMLEFLAGNKLPGLEALGYYK